MRFGARRSALDVLRLDVRYGTCVRAEYASRTERKSEAESD